MAKPKSLHHYVDEIGMQLLSAEAIIDCAVVLSALAAMPPVRHEGFVSGQGIANGFELKPDSLPTMLNHAASLIRDANAKAVEWHRETRSAPTLKVVGGSNGR